MRGHCLQLCLGVYAKRGNDLARVVIWVSRKSVRRNLCDVGVPVFIGIIIFDSPYCLSTSPIDKIGFAIGIHGITDITASVIPIRIVAPLATPEACPFSRLFFILPAGMACRAMIQFGSCLFRIYVQELYRILLPFVMVSGKCSGCHKNQEQRRSQEQDSLFHFFPPICPIRIQTENVQ